IEGVWSLEGPEELTADDLFEIAGEGGEPVHLDPSTAASRLTELLEIPVSVRATESFAAPSVANVADGAPPKATTTFGVPMTPFEQGLRDLAARASKGADRVRRDA
ncbi:MAG: hypothetical protein M3M99_02715, partial [Actinomycetota bacterium]|nr:hypothetical protein [Actinomycetota bacterium]